VEAGLADLPFADVFVAVEMGAERAPGVVRVHHFDEVEAEYVVGRRYGFFEAGGGGDVEAGREEVAGIETIRDGQIGFAGGEIANEAQLFEALADARATAHGVFEQHSEARSAEAGRGCREPESEGREPVFKRLVFVIARMQYEVFGANGFGAVEFAAKRRDRLRADFRIERREVDQIVGVDDEGRQVEPFARGGKTADIGGVGRGGAPQARAGGEYLKGVGAEPVGGERRVFERFGTRGVDADSQKRLS